MKYNAALPGSRQLLFQRVDEAYVGKVFLSGSTTSPTFVVNASGGGASLALQTDDITRLFIRSTTDGGYVELSGVTTGIALYSPVNMVADAYKEIRLAGLSGGQYYGGSFVGGLDSGGSGVAKIQVFNGGAVIDAIRVSSVGHVGINVIPSFKFQVKASGTSAAAYEVISLFNKSNATGTGVVFYAKDGAARIASDWRDTANVDLVLSSVSSIAAYQEQITLQASTGYVGIRVVPASPLHLRTATDNNLEFRDVASAGVELLAINDARNVDRKMSFQASEFVFNNGKVGIGATPIVKFDVNGITSWQGNSGGIVASFSGANAALNGGGNLRVLSNSSAAVDLGGSIVLGGYYNGTSSSIDYAEIAGRKENGTAGNTDGYLVFGTRIHGAPAAIREAMRIDSQGYIGKGTVRFALIDASSTNYLLAGTSGLQFNNAANTNMLAKLLDSGLFGINVVPTAGQLHVVSNSATLPGLVVSTAPSPTTPVVKFEYNGAARFEFNAKATQNQAYIYGSNFGNNLTGPQLYFERNSNGGAEGPTTGNIGFLLADGGGNSFFWSDVTGKFRRHTGAPTGSTGSPSISDTAGVVVGDQTSWHLEKDIHYKHKDGKHALRAIMQTDVYDFSFIENSYKDSADAEPIFTGLVIFNKDEWYGKNYGRQQLPCLNNINITGYTILAIQELTRRLELIESRN